jgi:hypothetical protein
MNLLGAISILGIIFGFCILLSLGAVIGRRVVLDKLNKSLLLIGIIGVVIYIVYSAWYLFVVLPS